MIFGPVFTAEIITSSRRRRNFSLRIGYGLLLLAALCMVYSEYWRPWRRGTVQESAMAASAYFGTFATLQLLGVVLIAPALAAGAIASERERRTIEYLFATDLSNWEIVFGKFMAALMRSVAFLLVGPPILSLAMWMGGVGIDRLLAVLLITLSTLVAVTALAVAVSVWSPKARQAVIRCYVALLILLLVPAFLNLMLSGGMWQYPAWAQYFLQSLASAAEVVVNANPFYVLAQLMGATGRVGFWELLGPMLRDHAVLALVCLVAAPWAVRRVHLRKSSAGVKGPSARAKRRAVGDRPMLWKELYAERMGNRLGWAGRLLLFLLFASLAGFTLWAFLQALIHDRKDFEPYAVTIAVIACSLTVLGVGARAATCVTAEKERDTWLTLVSTTLTPREIVLSKCAGAMSVALPLLFLLAALWIMTLALTPDYFIAIPPTLFSLTALVAFASALGTWFSLWCQNSTRALGATLGTLVLLGGAYLPFVTCCCGGIFFSQFIGTGPSHLSNFVWPHVFTPCGPYLLGLPSALPSLLRYNGSDLFEIESVGFMSSYLVGNAAYLVATFALLQKSTLGFDALVGRVTGGPGRTSPLPPQTRSLVLAEVIEEGGVEVSESP